eukprot:993810_1
MDAISTKTWDINWADPLTSGRKGTRAVVYGTDIYVIGGKDNNGDRLSDINVINTMTGTVSSGDTLDYATSYASSIIVGNTLYAFAGWNNNRELDTYQYSLLPTKDPTAAPTLPPSNALTLGPSEIPSNNPTSQPSDAPTLPPTHNPSAAPTSNPSHDASTIPTNNPTLYPSELHSAKPSVLPTKQSTNDPISETTKQPDGAPITSFLHYAEAEAHDESTTAHTNDVGSEAVNKYVTDLFLIVVSIVASLALFACVLGLIIYVIFARNKKMSNMHHDEVNVKSTVDESQQQRMEGDKNRTTLAMAQVVSESVLSLQNVKKVGSIEMSADHRNELQVKHWLENVVHLPIYYKHFVDSGYETLTDILSITNEAQVVEIGVKFKAHRVLIMDEIQQLRREREDEGRQSIIEANTQNVTFGGDVITQEIEDDFIVIGDDEVESGMNATLQ